MTDSHRSSAAQIPTANDSAALVSVLCRSSSSTSEALSSTLCAGASTPTSSRETLRYEMTRVEQVARKAAKSYVLDEKNALLILAIPDHDEYKILPPYSCRELTDRRRFVGVKDFVTRHNPQGTVDFKSQYSREIGTLARKRSVVSPPTSPVQPTHPQSSLGIRSSMRWLFAPEYEKNLWKLTHDNNHKGCWVLTDFGLSHLIGPEYRISTRLPVLPKSTSAVCSPPTSLPKNAMTSARKGFRVDLTDEKQLACLSRIEVYRHSPTRSKMPHPIHSVNTAPIEDGDTKKPTVNQAVGEKLFASPYQEEAADGFAPPCGLPSFHPIPEVAMEIVPSSIALDDLRAKEVFLFPLRIRNIGVKQNRFRVHNVTARCGGHEAVTAKAHLDKPTGRLAAGLSTIVTLTFCFEHPGAIEGVCWVETENGQAQVPISGYVRV